MDMNVMRIVCVLAFALSAPLVVTASSNAACPKAGWPAPQISGQDLQGQAQKLEDYAGKWVYIDFWATWCSPCMYELPSVVALSNELSNRDDFAVLSVSLDSGGKADEIRRTAKRNGVNYPVVYDGGGWNSANARGWCVNAIPAKFLIDPKGNIVAEGISPSDVQRYLPINQSTNQASLAQAPVTATAAPAARVVEQQYQPGIPKCSERLLCDSPSSGNCGLRDLEISVYLPDSDSFVSRYQLSVCSMQNGPDGMPYEVKQRFDLDIAMDPNDPTRPLHVAIRNTSGGSNAGGSMCVAFDPMSGRCQLVVPVPAGSKHVEYVLALYDDQMDRYFDNGTINVETAI